MGTLSVEKQEKLEKDAQKAERKAEKKAEQEAKKKEVRALRLIYRIRCQRATFHPERHFGRQLAVSGLTAGRKDRHQTRRAHQAETPNPYPWARPLRDRPKESRQDDG